jgi:hypothetical protein
LDGRTIEIARTLARRRSTRLAAALLAGVGVAAGGLPLLDAPGYELAEAAAVVAALAAPFAGIAAARIELARAAPSPLAAWRAASLVAGALVALLASGATVRAALGPCAAIGAAAGFLPLLAVPSVLLGSALAVAVAFVARGRRARAAALYALAAVASLAATLHAAWRGPAAFAFDPLLGGWPGPIYDEALVPDLRTVLLAAAAVAQAIAVVAVAEAFVRGERSGLRAAVAPALAAIAAVAALAGARAALEATHLSGSRAAVAAALGGRREGRRCTLVLPSEKPAAAADALLAECEFHLADVSRALGIDPPERVTAWVYRSAEEKRRLVGAAATEYAKPWLREIHLVDGPSPHPLLRHELVHAAAAEIARGPLRVPARAAVLVSAGLVEGLAAALETPRGRFTVHEWSRAARDLGLLPDLARIVGPAGFYAEPPARAYAAAGSFLAFLLERRGAAVVREAYRTGDVAAAARAPLAALAEEWRRFLDGVELPPALVEAARPRLERGSIFARRCAREVATLEARAAAAGADGRTAEACALYERAAARSGAAAASLRAAGDVRARAGDLDGAARAYAAARAAAGKEGRAFLAPLSAAEADLAWRRGEIARAREGWEAALAAFPDRADARLLEAKLVAAADPELGPAARPLLLGEGDSALALARVARVRHPLAAYLVGRALAGRGEVVPAIPELERAAAAALPATLARESLLLLGDARCAAGARAAGEAALRTLLAAAPAAADRARAEESLRRCAFPTR